MSNVTYTLYSEEKKKIILTFYRTLVKDLFCDDDNCVRFYSVINGAGTYTIDGKTEKFVTGDSFVVDKGRKFQVNSDGDIELFVMKFNLSDFIDKDYKIFAKETLDKFFEMLDKNTEKINTVHLNGKKIQEAIFMIENEFENKTDGSDFVIKAYIMLVLSLTVQYYSDCFSEGSIKRTANCKNIERTLIYINDNISSKITLEELAQIANMGKTNYCVTFKNVTGMTVWEYLLNARVSLATSYMIENKDDFNVTEIAFMCGFNSPTHFSKTFKKIKGQSPREYKKNQENPCF